MFEPKSAIEELEAYGYVRDADADIWHKPGALTEMWGPRAEGGWFCLRPADQPVAQAVGGADPAGGAPWGILSDVGAGWMQVPYGLLPKWAGVSGLHPATHTECFEWGWPDAVVAERYAVARAQNIEGRQIVRDEETGALVEV